jgi:hypothetical protein
VYAIVGGYLYAREAGHLYARGPDTCMQEGAILVCKRVARYLYARGTAVMQYHSDLATGANHRAGNYIPDVAPTIPFPGIMLSISFPTLQKVLLQISFRTYVTHRVFRTLHKFVRFCIDLAQLFRP